MTKQTRPQINKSFAADSAAALRDKVQAFLATNKGWKTVNLPCHLYGKWRQTVAKTDLDNPSPPVI